MNDFKKNINLRFNTDLIKSGAPVYIFGAKQMGHCVYDCLKKAGIDVYGFIDNNKSNSLDIYSGKKIYAPNNLINITNTSVIIIASINYVYEIKEQLKSLGFKNIIPAYILEFCNYIDYEQNPALKNLVIDYEENKQEYEEIRKLLCDDLSQKTLDALIEFRKTFDIDVYQKIKQPLKKQYFEDFIPDSFKYKHPFADCGAYNGDTALKFCKFTNNNYSKIYFIEADPKTYETGKRITQCLDNIVYCNIAVSNSKKKLNFSADCDTGSKITKTGNIIVNGIDLDSLIKEEKCFIKMDVEGAENEAIIGSQRLIKNGSLLAISVYHKAEDIRILPKTILNINKNYKFYLRHYTDCVFETVLYAVPISSQ